MSEIKNRFEDLRLDLEKSIGEEIKVDMVTYEVVNDSSNRRRYPHFGEM
jgi:hypothetical protein